MERCLACEADIEGVPGSSVWLRRTSREADGAQGRRWRRPIIRLHGWAGRGTRGDIERWQKLGMHRDVPCAPSASLPVAPVGLAKAEARQRSRAKKPAAA